MPGSKSPSFAPVVLGVWTAAAALGAGQAAAAAPSRTGKQIFLETCAACHGPDGRGQSRSRVGFDVPLPDFTDSSFASREPEADWVGVAKNGGPSRGFSEIMPSFGKALAVEEIALAVAYIKTFSEDERWPPGEFNLPRPLVTGKAYPEDEAVFTLAVNENMDSVTGKLIYEKRFGPRNMWEVVVPFGWSERPVAPADPPTRWGSSFGDVAVAVKSAFYHDIRRGSILSGVAELILPTGDEASGFGKGTFVLEPFLAYGQILPADFFLQAQAGLELPFRKEKAESEAFLRLALGRSVNFKPYGRTWSPMVELLAAKELVAGEKTLFDVVPQVQVTLNKRQHIMFNIGVRLPLNETRGRSFTVLAYLIWDWFDGAFFDGW
ncbi:MAG: c-type cytochrome [Candidatus Aminicenantes bacterium]|nr:c-type cytochrome [Candidatus Aminicenantes bacterium]